MTIEDRLITAIEALKIYADVDNWECPGVFLNHFVYNSDDGFVVAKQALQEIEGGALEEIWRRDHDKH